MKHSRNKKKQKFNTTQKIMFGVIAACFVVVIFFLIFSIINRPENRIPRLISHIAEDYYENTFYEEFSKTESFKNNTEKTMEEYVKYGFTAIDLKTLLLYGDQKNAEYAKDIKKYCNVDGTTVKFYPEAPFGKKDYRAQYTYSCEFSE